MCIHARNHSREPPRKFHALPIQHSQEWIEGWQAVAGQVSGRLMDPQDAAGRFQSELVNTAPQLRKAVRSLMDPQHKKICLALLYA